MNFELFLGRFHPLVVHLPIGFLLLSAIMEGLSYFFKDKFKNLDLAIALSLLCSGFGAILSGIIGLLLAGGGGYDDQTLFWHKWLGISLSVFSFLAWAIKTDRLKIPNLSSSMVIGLLVVIVSITGHLGGNLTHGSDYLLVYAPKFVQKIGGMNADEGNRKDIPAHPDSVLVFQHLVLPTLKKKCASCHGDSKSQGDLRLTSAEFIDEGGEGGEVVVPGKAFESKLFVRTTLPQSSKKFMPPKGDPLTYSELKILEWWMASGASYEARLTTNEVPKEIHTLLLRDFGVDSDRKPYYEMVKVPMLTQIDADNIQEAGFNARILSNNNYFLQVKPSSSTVTKDQLESLLPAKEQITWLYLGGSGVTDEMLGTIGVLSNITRLRLQNNSITDEGVKSLNGLIHLESLNLYGNAVTDASLPVIQKMTSLKRVYLWQTEVTDTAVEELRKARPDLEVQLGITETAGVAVIEPAL
ncbi:MAG: hypothetical protein NWS46_08480 [Cyclobacteriaceae bacterium]|jgi:uncharacterized membrane protein|nr:hypothetical protein [Cyclobacteriaceae bacterium]